MPYPHAGPQDDDTRASGVNGDAALPVPVGGPADGLTRAQVAKVLCRSLTTVRRLESSGRLNPVLVDGVHRFDPAEVEALAATLQEPEDDGARKSELEVKVGAVTDLVSSAQTYAERSIELLLRGVDAMGSDSRQMLQAVLAENRRLSAEAVEHHKELAAMRREHREYLDEKARREREDKERDAALRQKEQNLSFARKLGEHLMPAGAAILGKYLGVNLPAAQLEAVTAILGQLDDEKKTRLMMAIGESGALTQEQQTSLLALFEAAKPSQAAAAPTAPSPPGPPTPDASLADRRAYWARETEEIEAEMDALVRRAETAETAMAAARRCSLVSAASKRRCESHNGRRAR